MPYVAATCPHCTGDLRIDLEMEKGYCTHCGSMINFAEAVKTVKLNGPIEFAGYESLPTLLNLIEKGFRDGTNQTPEFKSQLIRALELAPDNQYLYSLVLSQIWEAEITDNVLVNYHGSAPKVVIPEGIVTIAKGAFARHAKIKEIVLPKSVRLIMEGAFIFERQLIIHAYKNTYAAQYAMSSPAILSLLDYKNDSEKHLEAIESILRQFDKYKHEMQSRIEKHFERVYSINWAIVFLILLLPVYIILSTFRGNVFLAGAAVLSAIFIVASLFTMILKIGYDEILRKVAVKKQLQLFMDKCNVITKPLGIIDFKYHRNIFEDMEYNLESEVSKLERVRDRVFKMDQTEIFKKPNIQYSFMDYVKGHRPAEYDSH